MDILRALASPDIEVRRKTLDLALDLVTSRNVEDFVKFLEKEVALHFTILYDSSAKYIIIILLQLIKLFYNFFCIF